MTSETPEPLYEHDCKSCHYLGQYEDNDLYYCDQMLLGPTVIARYGNLGSSYTSGLALSPLDHRLMEAKRRASAVGLLPKSCMTVAEQIEAEYEANKKRHESQSAAQRNKATRKRAKLKLRARKRLDKRHAKFQKLCLRWLRVERVVWTSREVVRRRLCMLGFNTFVGRGGNGKLGFIICHPSRVLSDKDAVLLTQTCSWDKPSSRNQLQECAEYRSKKC